jgi:antitoxin (DNA-binding transcriptional repressor) of toxin-antitoxin stability system
MSTIEVSEAAARLSELVARVQSGETIALVDGDKQVATLGPPPASPRLGYGSLEGKMWMSDDFDEPLDDLKDYV